jgi:hypothetical protein
VETYKARKEFVKDPQRYFTSLRKLATPEKTLAFKMMKETGLPMMPSIPTNKAQLAIKLFNRLRKGVDVAVKSSSIGI